MLLSLLFSLVAGAAPLPSLAELPTAGPRHALHVANTLEFAAGDRLRLAETVDGLPVYGNRLVVVQDPTGATKRVIGAPLVHLPATTPTLSLDAALKRAEARVPPGPSSWATHGHLAVLAQGDRGVLVWQVRVGRLPVGDWTVTVDAHSGQVLSAHNGLHTARGNVYAPSPALSDLVMVSLGAVEGDTLVGPYAEVQSCTSPGTDWWDYCGSTAPLAFADSGGDFFFQPDAVAVDDPLAEVNAYYHTGLVARALEARGFRHSADSQMRRMSVFVNMDYENAFFGDMDGDGRPDLAFGHYETIDFAYDGDVVYHEYGHSLFGALVGDSGPGWDLYGVNTASGALNEGSADVLTMLITGDPQVGEYAGIEGPIRDLEQDLLCREDFVDQNHADGMIWGALWWNLLSSPAFDRDTVFDLFLGSLAVFPPNYRWADAGEAVADTATDMLQAGLLDQAQWFRVLGALDQAGVAGCSYFKDGLGEHELQVYGYAGEETLTTHQYVVHVPQGAERLGIRLDALQVDGGLKLHLYARRGLPIEHEAVETDEGYVVPVPTVYDYKLEDLGPGSELVYGPTGIELKPGLYYFALTSSVGRGYFDYGTAKLVVELTEGEPTGGCNTGGGSGSGVWLLLALGAALRRRRVGNRLTTRP